MATGLTCEQKSVLLLANITEQSEDVVRDFIGNNYFVPGSEIMYTDFLTACGFFSATKRQWCHGHRREEWPPAPWAPKHLVLVVSGNEGFAVFMGRDGAILDPQSSEPHSLDEYDDVLCVIGISAANWD